MYPSVYEMQLWAFSDAIIIEILRQDRDSSLGKICKRCNIISKSLVRWKGAGMQSRYLLPYISRNFDGYVLFYGLVLNTSAVSRLIG